MLRRRKDYREYKKSKRLPGEINSFYV